MDRSTFGSVNGMLPLFTWLLYRVTKGLFTETAGLRTASDKQSRNMGIPINTATDAVQNGITANQIAITNAQQQLRANVTAKGAISICAGSRRKWGLMA